MYKITVPVVIGDFRKNPEESLKELNRFSPDRIFVVTIPAFGPDQDRAEHVIEECKWCVGFLRENGYAHTEIGAWTTSLEGHTAVYSMKTLKGDMIPHACPSDPVFIDICKRRIRALAKTGVDMIMLDDDLRYGFMGVDCGCLCDHHVKAICEEVGETLTAEQLAPLIKNGSQNPYRDAFLRANGRFLENYARELRAALDEVNPHIRLGACACMTSWDFDGTDAARLSKIFAGNTSPFARQIGAPYWSSRYKHWGNDLQDTIELERMEAVWTRVDGVENFAEGDTFPRPRINCPASFLEIFDTAIRAAGCTDGILKYGAFNPAYEKGYANFHERNRGLYQEIDEHFGEKTACGVRVYESMKKISQMVNPNELGENMDLQDTFFSYGARALAACSIPTTYEGEGVTGILFGENARHFSDEILDGGLILDMLAAKILTDRGHDVGLLSLGDACQITSEYFTEYDENTGFLLPMTVYDCSLNPKAEVCSVTRLSEKTLPLSYRYENDKGQRFFVLNINPRLETPAPHYLHSRRYADAVKWLSGKSLPAYCPGHPKLYTLCKEGEGSLAVGLWNIFADIALSPVVQLTKTYRDITFINCEGRLESDKVYLSDINPYAFAGFEVKE